ncbi:thermonuclease family protein [Qipengyuania sp. 483]
MRQNLNLRHGIANCFRTGAKRIFPQISRLPTPRIFARLQPQLQKIWLLPMILFPILCAACSPLPVAVAIDTSCSVTEGDTIRCGDERIRLLGIDAPEKPGHCRLGRQCAPGDPFASNESLQNAFGNGPLSIVRLGEDHYGRTLALVRAGETDLSCHQLAGGQAIYVERWDDERAVARTCPDFVRN